MRRWSYSSLREFQQCPFRWKLRRLDKLPVPPPADDSPLTRGSLYHLKIEEYIRSGTEPLPDIKNPLAKEVIELCREKFLAGVGEPEKPTYLDTNWLPTQKNAADHWLTAITDFEYIEDNILYIIDWKTGKPRNKEVPHALQAQLYAVVGLAANPQVDAAETWFVYLDTKSHPVKKRIARTGAEPFRISWHNQAVKLSNATDFPAKPIAMNCRYCDFGTQVGSGACPYDHFGTTALLPSTGSCRVPVPERSSVFSLRPWNGQNPRDPALHYSREELNAYFQSIDNSPKKHPPTELDDGHHPVHGPDLGNSGSGQA